MFSIQSWDINEQTSSPLFKASWVTRYEGFELLPENKVKIAVSTENEAWFKYLYGEWVGTDSPVYYSPQDIRVKIKSWRNSSIQFHFSQVLSAKLKLGYYISGEIVDFLANFEIPNFIQKYPYEIQEWVFNETSTNRLKLPQRLIANNIKYIQVCKPEGGWIEAEIINNEVITKDELPRNQIRLNIGYMPLVQTQTPNDIFQINELPCIFIKPEGGTNYKHVCAYSEYIRDESGNFLVSESSYQYDQIFEILALSERDGEARNIVQHIANNVLKDSRLFLLPFNQEVFMRVYKPPKVINNVSWLKGNVKICSLNVVINNLLSC